MVTMAIEAMGTPLTRMDGRSMLDAMSPVSAATIRGRSITSETGVTMRSAVGITEALAAVGTREASAMATVAETIDERRR